MLHFRISLLGAIAAAALVGCSDSNPPVPFEERQEQTSASAAPVAEPQPTAVAESEAEQKASPAPTPRDGADEPIVDWPTGLTDRSGVRVGPYFSRDELRAINGKFLQEELKPGWQLERVVEVLGKPTRISRTNGLTGKSPEQVKKFMDDPLIPPDVKAHLSKVLETCTWSFADDPDTYFIMLGFEDGQLTKHGIVLKVPK